MDIKIPAKKPYRRYLLVATVAAIGFWLLLIILRPAVPTVSLHSVSLTTVQQADLTLYSDAIGELFSRHQRLLTAPASGIIAEILHRPGSEVDANTIIIRIDNPELDQQVIAASNAMQRMQVEIRAFTAQQSSQLLEQQGRAAELENQLAQADLELRVNEELAANGVAARIELQRAGLRVTQHRQQLEFEHKKQTQFALLQQAELAQKQLQLQQLTSDYQLLQQQQASMQLTAGIAGYLQQLEVELGQSVNKGQALARVGSQHQLNARILLNQRHAEQVYIGNHVTIESRFGLIQGQISRIEAVVQQGSVLAEVQLPDELPAGSRPQQNITAKVQLGHRAAALFVTHTAGLKPHSTQRLFVKTATNRAEPREVQFGELSGRQLLITAGLVVNEQFLAMDKPEWQQYPFIKLK
ncbi:hypothetical protein WG68_07885 [Arsukibacterium ikkense]|uniref:RND transporter n=1 Tax=Arsukibacterium ikkense TaxID=336831 RepID=A0A0M2V569_9GAMM|nr:HlyD family efflux transporter periplasmic adaptor subunit [Arsukibacterium ikkense]KKO46007.1 hypothetical protein WG68_07885 [Arsukibacterium ikkense]